MKTNTQVPKFYAWNTVTGQYYSRVTQAFTAPGQFSYCELDAQQLAVVRATFRNVESCPCPNPTPEPDAPAKPVTVVPQVEYNALCAVAEAAQKFYQYYFNDLAKNNPGFIAKLYVQDYGAMNDAYCAIEQARAKLAKARKGN